MENIDATLATVANYHDISTYLPYWKDQTHTHKHTFMYKHACTYNWHLWLYGFSLLNPSVKV